MFSKKKKTLFSIKRIISFINNLLSESLLKSITILPKVDMYQWLQKLQKCIIHL